MIFEKSRFAKISTIGKYRCCSRKSDSVRSRQKFALNEMNGHRSSTIVNLGIIAVRLGRTLHYNPETQRFNDDEAANRLIDQPMRAPWTL